MLIFLSILITIGLILLVIFIPCLIGKLAMIFIKEDKEYFDFVGYWLCGILIIFGLMGVILIFSLITFLVYNFLKGVY